MVISEFKFKLSSNKIWILDLNLYCPHNKNKQFNLIFYFSKNKKKES